MATIDTDKVIPMGAPTEVLGRAVGREVGKRRMDIILEKDEARALVRALPAEDLFFLIKEVGLEDAGDLVALAAPEQFQAFIDLDAWQADAGELQLSPEETLRWLAASRAGDPESHDEKVKRLDLEIIEILLKHGIAIIDRREEEESKEPTPPEHDDLNWTLTPCGNFYIAFTMEPGAELIELKRILDDLYTESPFGAARLLSAVRWELRSELEDHSLRFRNGRLEDLGFPPPEVAASLYARTDPDAPPPPQPEPTDEVPGFFLAEFQGGSFLDRAAARVEGVELRTRLDRALMYLANTAMVADRVDPGDLDRVRETVARMHAYLNLGLHHLAKGDPERGAALLGTAAPKHVFQVGYTLTLQLAWRVQRLVRDLGLSRDDLPVLLDAPEGPALAAIDRRRPLYPVALDAARAQGWPEAPEGTQAAAQAPDVGTPAGVRAFAAPEDLELAGVALSRAEALLRAGAAAGLLTLPDPDELPWSLPARALTAALNEAAGRGFSPAELPADALAPALAAALDEAGRVRAAFADGLRARLASGAEGEQPGATGAGAPAPDGGALLAAAALALLTDAFGPVVAAGETPEARFAAPAVRVQS